MDDLWLLCADDRRDAISVSEDLSDVAEPAIRLGTSGSDAVILTRPDATRLRDWLTAWLEEG